MSTIMMQLRYRWRNFLGNLFRIDENKYLDEMKENARCAMKHRHLAWYWERVAKGKKPMPGDKDDVQLLADNGYRGAIIIKYMQAMQTSPENKFKVKSRTDERMD